MDPEIRKLRQLAPIMGADLFGAIEPNPTATWQDHFPGLTIVPSGALAAPFSQIATVRC